MERWEALGRCCTVCHKPCEPFGRNVVWDHPIGVFYGEETDPDRMEPHHAAGCAPSKTAKDATARAKVKRLIKKQEPRAGPGQIRHQGFSKIKRPLRPKKSEDK